MIIVEFVILKFVFKKTSFIINIHNLLWICLLLKSLELMVSICFNCMHKFGVLGDLLMLFRVIKWEKLFNIWPQSFHKYEN
jgi:hypothetical protein